MKKYFIKNSTDEVKLGDTLTAKVEVNEESINMLIAAGIIEESNELSMEDVIDHLDNRIDCDVEVFLENLEKVNKKALFITLIKEAALVLDNKYKGHIKYSDEIWGVSMATYTPFLVCNDKDQIMNTDFTKIAAFRCAEDAEEAVKVLKPIIDNLR